MTVATPWPRLRGEFHPLPVAEVSRLCEDAVAMPLTVAPGPIRMRLVRWLRAAWLATRRG